MLDFNEAFDSINHVSSYLGMKISLVSGFPLDSLAKSGFP